MVKTEIKAEIIGTEIEWMPFVDLISDDEEPPSDSVANPPIVKTEMESEFIVDLISDDEVIFQGTAGNSGFFS